MKRKLQLLAITLLLLSACACQGKKQEKEKKREQKEEIFGTIDLNDTDSTRDLKFSQLSGNIRCIPLETRPDFILPDNDLRLWVSDRHIITISSKDIRQFSPDGRFIRKLASAGKGPDEYTNLISYTVDEHNDILYYGHRGNYNSIYAISLRDGRPVGKINSTGCLPVEMSIIDGNIFCIPLNNQKKLDAFIITPSGKITDSLPTPPATGQKLSGIPAPFLRSTRLLPGNKGLHLLKKDTIFKVDSGQLQAVAEVRCNNKPGTTGNTNYNTYRILLKNKDYFITVKQNQDRNNGSVTLYLDRNITLLTNTHTFKTARLDKFIIDPLDQESSDFPAIYVSGKKLSCTMSAFDIKDLAKEKRKAGQALPPALQQLDRQLTEESNPVIIVGDLK